VAQSNAFASDGEQGLEVVAPADGNWYGRILAEPLDLSAFSTLKVDLATSVEGTSGEFALQVGPASSWCQGSLWTWTNPNKTGTIKRSLDEIACPSGTTKDLTQVRAIWVFLKAGTFQIDNVRAE
jgi:alpha-galactosidase